MIQNGWQLKLIQLLAVPGLLVAYYLLLFHNGDLVAGCSSSGWDDCGLVSGPDGQFSAIGPIPGGADWAAGLRLYLPAHLAA